MELGLRLYCFGDYHPSFAGDFLAGRFDEFYFPEECTPHLDHCLKLRSPESGVRRGVFFA
jgi:hypothetical protein